MQTEMFYVFFYVKIMSHISANTFSYFYNVIYKIQFWITYELFVLSYQLLSLHLMDAFKCIVKSC